MSIENQVKKVIAEQLEINIDQISIDSHLIKDLGADSLDLIEATMELEDAFNCVISSEEMESFKTVSDIIKWVTPHHQKDT
jgi:acyl carrier protein